MSTPDKVVELDLTLVVKPDTHIAIKLFCRLAERMGKAKSEKEQLVAIRQFSTELEEAKNAQARLDHLAGESGRCECPACEFKREVVDTLAPRLDRPQSLIAWARVLVQFVTRGLTAEATKANEMFGNTDLTVADYSAAGVSERDCMVLLAVMPAGSFISTADAASAAAPAAAPAAAQEAPPATA